MDYEKKYKESFDRAKKLKETCDSSVIIGWMEYIFPELKESKDEKIRKAILELVRQSSEILDKQNQNNMIAWLEKQGEVMDKEIVFRPLAGTDVRIAAKQALEKIEIGKEIVLAFNGAYIPVNGKTVSEICNEYFSWSKKQNKNNSKNYCEDCINRKGCINCENGNLKETISLTSCEKQDEQDFSHNVDDEIRNELYDFIYITTFQPKDLKKKERFLDWIEKQGKQKFDNIEDIVEIFVHDEKAYTNPASFENSLGRLLKLFEKVPKQDLLDGLKFYTNVVEHNGEYIKPIDKSEPKFHEGDWIVNNDSGGVHQVIKIRDDEYCLWPLDSEIQGYLRVIDVDTEYHLWTIKDAKDGDVLIYGDNSNAHHVEVTMIFKSIRNEKSVFTHFHIFDDEFRVNDWCDCGKTVHPAIKEQRDLLFQKMKEAGYEWDSEKKVPIDKNSEQESKEEIKTTAYGTFGEYGVVEYVYILDYCSGRVIVAKHDIKESIEDFFKKLGLKESQCHYMVSSDVLSIEYINF